MVSSSVDRLNTLLIIALAIPPTLRVSVRIFCKLGAVKEMFYYESIWASVLSIFREENIGVRELARPGRGA